jgi:hypothetical protein
MADIYASNSVRIAKSEFDFRACICGREYVCANPFLQRSSGDARTSNGLHAPAAPSPALLGSPATVSCVKLIFRNGRV